MNKLFVLGFMIVSSSVLAAPPLYPLENFAKLPQYSNPIISPDGRKIAATLTVNGKPVVYIKNRDDPTKIYPPINAGDAFLNDYFWGNNERLLVGTRQTAKIGKNIFNYTRYVSAKYNGESVVALDMKPNRWGYFLPHVYVVGKSDTDDSHILMAMNGNPQEWMAPEVDLVDLATGKGRQVQDNTREMQNWIADHKGEIRIGTRYESFAGKPKITIFYRTKKGEAWQTLQKMEVYNNDRLYPYGFDPLDDNILLVTTDNLSQGEEENFFPEELKLFRYNLTTRAIEGEHKDPEREKALATAKKALPDRKISILSMDHSKKVFTLAAYSDNQTPLYFLLDRNTKTMDMIGSPYPALEGGTLSKMAATEYKARDGHSIPAYLTLPEGSNGKNLPFVIYVHGGPYARDDWGFDNYVQFFANRGYGVLQPEFRGSRGFGKEHEEAGYRQWGLLMQDDVTDGVKWLISQGIADPKRICIVGASYGGYAAATGLAKTPDLYKCGISINGVMDMDRWYSRLDAMRHPYRAMLNDPSNFKANSPYYLAESIKAPLLIIASEKDTVVPVIHSQDMRDKMEKLKKPVTYVELKNGEHWRTIDANEIATFKAMETFLAAQLGS